MDTSQIERMGRFESIGPLQPFLKLQEGDWADVFKAYDTSLERNVLLKKLRSEFQNDADIAQRFEDEARLMARIQHPNVVSVLSSGRYEATVYFVAEFIEGKSLNELVAEGGMPALLSLYVLREITNGLKAAHDKQIFHRDIKPSNILLSHEGEVKLADFGMASILDDSEVGEVRGTLGYIAPELLLEAEPGVKSDLFSLGATFFEMLTGQPAFFGGSTSEVFDKLLNHDPIPLLAANPKVNPAIITICRTLLKKEPDGRYESCDVLIAEVERLLGAAPDFDGQHRLLRYLEHPDTYQEEGLALPTELITAQVEEEELLPADRVPVQRTSSASRWALGSVSLVVLTLIIAFATGNLDDTQRTPAELAAMTPADSLLNANVPESGLEMNPEAVVPSGRTGEEVNPRATELNETIEQVSGSQPVEETRVIEAELPSANVLGANTTESAVFDSLNTTATTSGDTLANAPRTGMLDLLCTPFCEVKINGELVGEAPPNLLIELPAGLHHIEWLNPDQPVHNSDVVVTAGQTETIKVALRDLVGTVEINVLPHAEVYINDVHMGSVPPMKSFILEPGVQHRLRLEHATLGVWETTLLVAAGEKQPQYYNLRELLEK